MSPDDNKELVLHLYEDLFNRGRLRLLNDLIAASFVNHAAPAGTPTGPESVRRAIAALRAAFPDNRCVIEDLIAEDDKVVARLTFSGTNAGEYLGLLQTGQRVVHQQIHILRIAEGRVAEQWAICDGLALVRQLGGRIVP